MCTLQLLHSLLEFGSPRIQFYSVSIIQTLLKLVVNAALRDSTESTASDELTGEITRVLVKIEDRSLVMDSLSGLVSKIGDDPRLSRSIEAILQAVTSRKEL